MPVLFEGAAFTMFGLGVLETKPGGELVGVTLFGDELRKASAITHVATNPTSNTPVRPKTRMIPTMGKPSPILLRWDKPVPGIPMFLNKPLLPTLALRPRLPTVALVIPFFPMFTRKPGSSLKLFLNRQPITLFSEAFIVLLANPRSPPISELMLKKTQQALPFCHRQNSS